MKVGWRRQARRDFEEIISYIADDSAQTADLIADRILTAVALLSKTPRAGRPGRVQGTREFIVSRTPFLLVYRIHAQAISILRVYRGARRWPARFD